MLSKSLQYYIFYEITILITKFYSNRINMVVFQKSSRNRVQQSNKTPELEDSFSIDKPDNNRNPYLRPIEFQVKTSRRRWNYRSVAEERSKVETFSRVREEELNLI